MTVRLAALAALGALIGGPRSAAGYEFWLRSQTIGQAYELRDYRLIGPDLFLGRRRYTQTLALRIWDIGDFAAERRRLHRPPGLRISWQSYLRIDHDFGDFSNGRIAVGAVRRDALDVIPELGESLIGFHLMYGYLEVAGIADDRVALRLGRLVVDDGWGTTAVDGGRVAINLAHTVPVVVSAIGGLRVRAASPLGSAAYELDGTAGAGCREYVEGAAPGTGEWRLIDRSRPIAGSRFTSDLEFCPQREQLQPTVGFAVATSRVRSYGVELGYLRTWSSTVGLIGEVDRLTNPDVGLYPNEFGQAPGTGVDQEYLALRAHLDRRIGAVAAHPYVGARWSLLHGAIDRADAGVRLTRGAHQLEPAIGYFLPTFDGDSIFNVFSIDPTSDARVDYRYDGGPVRGNARGWLRRYQPIAGAAAYAGGGELGVERMWSTRWRSRADLLYDDGYGGRRAGASIEAAWQATPRLAVRGREVVLAIASDDPTRARYVTTSTVASGTWRLGDTAALHAISELDHDAIHRTQLRAIVMLDLAFIPEL